MECGISVIITDMPLLVITTNMQRRSFGVPARPCPRRRHAVGDGRAWPRGADGHAARLFAGISLEGNVLAVRGDINDKFYGESVPDPVV